MPGLDGQWRLVAGAFEVDPQRGREFALSEGLDPARGHGTYQELITGEQTREDRVDAVAICTPNFTHCPIAKALIDAGFEASAKYRRRRRWKTPSRWRNWRSRAAAQPGAGLTADSLGERLLDPAVKLETSTPKAGPGGDYTGKMFALIDKQHPGALASLEAKADKVIGCAAPAAASDPNPIASAFAKGRINAMTAYCSGAEQMKKDVAGLDVVRIPAPFAVESD